jgi:hypothetical protein
MHCICHSLPFASLPAQLVTYMIFYAVKLLNYFPVKGGVSKHYSPKAIMSGEQIHYKYYLMPFGTYCQVHKEGSPRNNMAACTQGAISLGPRGNVQGGHKFFSLTTGCVINRRSWNIIPMPNTVIAWINTLGEGQPKLLIFHDCGGRKIGDMDKNALPKMGQEVDYDIPGVIGDLVKIPGVDMGGDDVTPKLDYDPELDYDLNFTPPQDEQQTHNQEPITTVPTANTSDPVISAPTPVAVLPPEGQRRLTRTRQTVQRYVPSTRGTTYSYAATQLAANKTNGNKEKEKPNPYSYTFLMMKNHT